MCNISVSPRGVKGGDYICTHRTHTAAPCHLPRGMGADASQGKGSGRDGRRRSVHGPRPKGCEHALAGRGEAPWHRSTRSRAAKLRLRRVSISPGPYSTQQRSRSLDYVVHRGVRTIVEAGTRHIASSDHNKGWVDVVQKARPTKPRPLQW